MDIRDALDLRPDTEHGLLVAYGEFARQNGLVDRLMTVPVPAKTRLYQPQTKVLELFVGILGGMEYLQDLDLGVHPLTKDPAVAAAWGQAGFAHYRDCCRTPRCQSVAFGRCILSHFEMQIPKSSGAYTIDLKGFQP